MKSIKVALSLIYVVLKMWGEGMQEDEAPQLKHILYTVGILGVIFLVGNDLLTYLTHDQKFE